MKESKLTEALKEKGATVFYGQKASNLTPDIDLAVYTSAIHPDNPEYIALKQLGLPSLTRAQIPHCPSAAFSKISAAISVSASPIILLRKPVSIPTAF